MLVCVCMHIYMLYVILYIFVFKCCPFKWTVPFKHTHTQMWEVTENCNFRLFAANGKKRQTYVCLLQLHTEVSFLLGRQTINGDRRLLFSADVSIYGNIQLIKKIPLA
jgi:hypothetical protein